LPRARLASTDAPAPVRFLPRWDEVVLAYDRRERILPNEYRRRVIAKNGDVAQTFLVDGFVAGTWELERGRVVPAPFEPLPTSVRRELADEARRLETFIR
jgi:Winged helix DNA-binding domain